MKRPLLGALCLLCLLLATRGSQFVPTTGDTTVSAGSQVPRSVALGDDQNANKGMLELSIIDAATGQPTPARVEIRGADGRFHIADNPLPTGSLVFYNFDAGEERTPGKQLFSGQRSSIRNPFTDSDEFYTRGNCRVTLLPGAYRVRVTKGPEFRRATETVRIEAGRPVRVGVRLERWANPPSAGWYSSDPHVHVSRTTPAVNPQILQWMQAEDIHVTNLLEWGHPALFVNTPQYAHGKESVYREGEYILASGQENPRTGFLGHTIVLGAERPINRPDSYMLYRPVFEDAHRQGALNGYAHLGTWFNAQNGLALDLPHKLIDFLEVLQFGSGEYSVWYNILNTGFRVTPTAGSDYPILFIPGWERFYTRVDGEFSYTTWLEGVRRGRTFVTNGPLLEFTVDGQGPGADVSLAHPQSVRIVGKVHFDPERDDVQNLEVIANGQILRAFHREPPASEIRCDFTCELNEACWLALRASGTKVDAHQYLAVVQQHLPSTARLDPPPAARALAHTAAVYVTMQGRPTLAEHPRARTAALAWLARLAEMEWKLFPGGLPSLATNGDGDASLEVLRRDRNAMLEAIAAARDHFVRQAEGGEGSPPP